VKCKNCGRETEVHLIDCRAEFNTPERAARYCPGCRPGYHEPGQRIFVVDRLDSYPIAERLADLRRTHCPSCGNHQAEYLVTNVQDGSQFCPGCAPRSFLPHLIFTEDDVKLLRAMGVDPEIGNIEDSLRTLSEGT